MRITVGVVFMGTGWTKLQQPARHHQELHGDGHSRPEILTPFVSGVEFVGGILLLVGLLTRFAAVPLMVVMVVAIIAAKRADIDSLETFLGFEEVSYFVMFAWLAIAGPGPGVARSFHPEGQRPDPAEHGALGRATPVARHAHEKTRHWSGAPL